MKRFLLAIFAVLFLQGCVSTDCDRLVYTDAPRSAEPLKYPADVREPTPSGDFRLPEVEGATVAGECLARPPQTLEPEAIDGELEQPEQETEEGASADEA